MAKENLHLMELQAEMLRLISTPDREKFTEVTEQLKAECQRQGDERLFYVAWGNQSTYEATRQNEFINNITNELRAGIPLERYEHVFDTFREILRTSYETRIRIYRL
ncbi:MAG: hypothetical protein IJ886_01210 [Prevotella sp.]|nr:hypothetical protein [Prevotella sp.]MBR2228878.1 hypothetical protein [Prevotella sp.]